MTVTTNYLVTGNGITGSTANAVQALVSRGWPEILVSPSGDISGVADSVAATAAFSAAAAGAAVVFDAGVFYFATSPTVAAPDYNTITFGKLGVNIRGQGPGATVLNFLTPGQTGFSCPTGTMMMSVRDMSIIGPGEADSESVALYFGENGTTGSHHLIENVEIKNWYSGFRSWQCAFFEFNNCFIWSGARGYEFGNNSDGYVIVAGRVSNMSNCGMYFGWKDASHSPGVVTENNVVTIIGTKFGDNAVSFDFSDYWSSNVKINAYFENEQKIAWLGDGVSTTSFTKCVEFNQCQFNRVVVANPQIEARNPTTAVGGIKVTNCRTDTADLSGGFLKAGPNIAVEWVNNYIPSTLYQVQLSATQNIKNIGVNERFYHLMHDRGESDGTINRDQSTATMTIATPGVITCADHKCAPLSPVSFTTTGALPTGIVSGTLYYVLNNSALTADTFHVSATPGGTTINTSGTQSGVHTMYRHRGIRSARVHSGSNMTFEAWERVGSDGKLVGQRQAHIADVDGKWVLYRGLVQLLDPITALPTASATYRGVMAYQAGAGGVADTIKCCMKTAADVYAWTTVVTGA